MLNTLFMKTWRDIVEHKGRSILVVLSIGLSTFTLGVILNSYAVFSREMTLDYLKSNPAAISFNLEQFNGQLIEQLNEHPALAEVDARRVISAQIKTQGNDWINLRLFVLHDYNDIKIDIVEPDQGSWPPQQGQILIERQAISVLGSNTGQKVQVKTRSGFSANLVVAGSVVDVGLPQADWENIVYGYISQATLMEMIGENKFNVLKVSLKNTDADPIERQLLAEQIESWLVKAGYQVNSFIVPPKGEHPHANITDGLFMIQKVFAILCCLLSAVLVFNLMSAMLSKQVKQIGVMKALGADSMQIGAIYYRGVVFLGLLGLLISLPSAYFVGSLYVDKLSFMSNMAISSYQVPFWVLLVQIILGIGIPIISAYWPIKKASQMSIKKSLMDYSGTSAQFGSTLFERCLVKLTFFSLPASLAIRNAVREKARFILTTTVLMFAAALFMTSFNIAKTMKTVSQVEQQSKAWAVEVVFQQPLKKEKIDSLVSHIEGISKAETFNRTNIALLEKDEQETHEVKVNLTDFQPGSNINLPIIDGSWLSKNTNNKQAEIVVSQLVLKHIPDLKLGMTLEIERAGKLTPFTLVGVVRTIGLASVYTQGYLSDVTNISNGLYLSSVTNSGITDSSEINKLAAAKQLNRDINQIAESNNIKVKYSSTAWDSAKVVDDHFAIIFSLMLLLTIIIIFIAAMGIILTMTTNIMERTREIGVLKAIGAIKGELIKMVMTEGALIAILAWFFACFVTLPLSYGVSYWLGELLIKTPFELTIDKSVFIYSLPLMVLVSVLASIVPMLKVTKLPVREALIYE